MKILMFQNYLSLANITSYLEEHKFNTFIKSSTFASDVSDILNLAVPSGTVGGRIAGI